jgi:hypothetical protein
MRSSIFEENFLLSADLPDRATVGEELGRGGADRDAAGEEFGPAAQGHHQGAVGYTGSNLNQVIYTKIEG